MGVDKINHKIFQKLLLSTLIAILFIVSFTSAALEVTDTTKLTIPINYENLRDNSRSLQINQIITLRNTGAASETYTLDKESVNTAYSLSLNQGTLNINSNSQADLGFTLTAPANADQGVSGTVARIKATSSTGTVTYFELKTEVSPMLELKNIIVFVNDAERTSVNEDGDKIRDLEPGDKVQMRFRLKNIFDRDYDYGQIDGTIKLELNENDFGEDIDEEIDFNLKGEDETQTSSSTSSSEDAAYAEFTVPSKAASGEYTLTVTIEGKDENRANYDQHFDLKLRVERRSNDVRIDSFTLNPTIVDCDRRAQLVARVTNYGTNKQRYTSLVFTNTDLGINSKLNFELDRGLSSTNTETKEQFIEINKNIAPGIYPITATAYYDYTLYGDQKKVELTVKACPTKETKAAVVTEENTKTPVTSTTTIPTTATSTPSATPSLVTESTTTATTSVNGAATIIKTIETAYTIEDLLTAILVVAIVFIAALIVIFFLMLLK